MLRLPTAIPEGFGAEPGHRQKESLKERAGQVASRVTDELREETSRRARGFLHGQKEQLAEELHRTAEVFRKSSQQFEQGEQGATAKYVLQVASQADRFSRYLRERRPGPACFGDRGCGQEKPDDFPPERIRDGFCHVPPLEEPSPPCRLFRIHGIHKGWAIPRLTRKGERYAVDTNRR